MLSRVESGAAVLPESASSSKAASRWAAFTGEFFENPAPPPAALQPEPTALPQEPAAPGQNSQAGAVKNPPAANRVAAPQTRPQPQARPQPQSGAPAWPLQDLEPADAVAALNSLLARLGFDPAEFKAEFKPVEIKYPGNSYMYDLIQVEVKGEVIGFHANSVRQDPRLAAANIAAMMGRPVINFSEFDLLPS